MGKKLVPTYLRCTSQIASFIVKGHTETPHHVEFMLLLRFLWWLLHGVDPILNKLRAVPEAQWNMAMSCADYCASLDTSANVEEIVSGTNDQSRYLFRSRM